VSRFEDCVAVVVGIFVAGVMVWIVIRCQGVPC
jgi:hypothetical protein